MSPPPPGSPTMPAAYARLMRSVADARRAGGDFTSCPAEWMGPLARSSDLGRMRAAGFRFSRINADTVLVEFPGRWAARGGRGRSGARR